MSLQTRSNESLQQQVGIDGSQSIVIGALHDALTNPQETFRLIRQPAETHVVREHVLTAAKAIGSRLLDLR